MAHPARDRNRQRVRARKALESNTNVVAFARTQDAQTLAQNPNKAKRHAAKLDNSPRFTFRQDSPGTHGQTERRFRYLQQTRNGRTLPLSKRVQKFETITEGNAS